MKYVKETVKGLINSRIFPYIFFLILTLIIFYKVFLKGWILFGSQDRMDQNEPAVYYYSRAFHNHELPQWNPYILCGTSGIGNAYCSFFYPFLAIEFLFPESYIP